MDPRDGVVRFLAADGYNKVIAEASLRPVTDEERAALLPACRSGLYSLEEVYTRPASRSQGWSTQVVGYAIGWAAKWGVPIVCRARAHGPRRNRLDQLQLESFYLGLGFQYLEQMYYRETWLILWPDKS